MDNRTREISSEETTTGEMSTFEMSLAVRDWRGQTEKVQERSDFRQVASHTHPNPAVGLWLAQSPSLTRHSNWNTGRQQVEMDTLPDEGGGDRRWVE